MDITIEDKFHASCFTLKKEDILKFDKEDNGPINNVLIGIEHHCYGVRFFDDRHGLSVEMFYINGKGLLKGDIIQLQVRDPQYYQLLLRFCVLLADDYKEVNALIAFNTFQNKLRGFLEKRGIFTVTSLELRQFKGQSAVMVSPSPRGIVKIDFINQKEFYVDFFNKIANKPIEKGKEHVYLMVNNDTGLIKIGRSNNPVYRERTLHSKEPSVHRIAMWCCEQNIEKKLHIIFKDKRIRGEWFRLSLADLIEIEKFMDSV
ncbi:GIY-YIG nuclease family protein [Flavobacterium zepuense]|uniref:GIY-YIG nuclease family protein n=1 Tax=Flavobacterium zepuense TaxID=2593302 RepID=A0A552UUR6_9FLAO|nr:GIY-YIG nuclease family protein [Flavobacterium zepuense]TRW21974.1 GIY-YIG nuclease family protein [Flavobacterium zepuense]